MTVCFFGNYILDYPRVRVLRKGFLENNVKIVECHTRQRGFQKYLDLYGQHKKLKNKYNILLVMMGGQTLVWFAKMLTKKKIIFDAFASLYLTNIEDRKTCNRKSIKALYYKLLDKYSCKLADKVLLDTNAQINYFVENYKLNKNKFIRVFVSSDFSSCGYGFRFCHSRESGNPEKTDNTSKYSESCVRHDMAEKKERGIVGGKFIIHWHGYIVPFYSLETVIKTAKILEKNHPESLGIEFQIVTRFNSKYEKIKNLVNSVNLNNIKFYPETNYKEINNFINNSDICLGIFGNNKKAQVVIPNKIYEAIVCAKPVIT
ncbi:MAG: hypothetical protein ABIF17_05290, partial [Patescibacteria group bacterium]